MAPRRAAHFIKKFGGFFSSGMDYNFPMKGYGKSVIGKRDMNQDAYLVFDEKNLYAVADGVGGGLKGEVASQIAIQSVQGAADVKGRLVEAVRKGQDAVLKEATDTIGEALMGTTLTTVRMWGNEAELVHVGDSRCYLYSGDHLKQLTEDHEIFDETIQAPVLASYLGISPEVHPITIQQETVPLGPGEKLLLCSDGLYKQITETRVVEVINAHKGNPMAALEELCDEAAKAEYSDNITIVWIDPEG